MMGLRRASVMARPPSPSALRFPSGTSVQNRASLEVRSIGIELNQVT